MALDVHGPISAGWLALAPATGLPAVDRPRLPPREVPLDVRLRGGRTVRIRAIRPADAGLLQAFDGGLSERSRRLRYLGWMPPMSDERAASLATVDFRGRSALVALSVEGGRETMVAECRLSPYPDRDRCAEIAIAVADALQGRGLGRAMLRLMVGVATELGLREVVAEVRYDNQRMMHLLREAGFQQSAWELGVVTFRLRPRGQVS